MQLNKYPNKKAVRSNPIRFVMSFICVGKNEIPVKRNIYFHFAFYAFKAVGWKINST